MKIFSNLRRSRFWCLSLILFALATSTYAQDKGDSKTEIIEPQLSLHEHESSLYAITIGKIRNKTEYTLEDLVIEVRYFDSSGKLIDVVVEQQYSISIPPNDEIAFKVQTLAAAPESKYASQSVRIVSAQEDIPCPGHSNADAENPWMQSLARWWPFLLMITIWIALSRVNGGKNSPQQRLAGQMDRQIELVEAQNVELKRIANAAEKNAGKSVDT